MKRKAWSLLAEHFSKETWPDKDKQEKNTFNTPIPPDSKSPNILPWKEEKN